MKNLPIVLVVEDDKAIVHLLSTILDANDYRVVQVSTGREALSTISSHCPDVVLLDLGLPDMERRGHNQKRPPVVAGADNRAFRPQPRAGQG